MAGKIDTSALGPTDGVLRQLFEDRVKADQLADARERLLGANNRTAIRPKDAAEAGIGRARAEVRVRKWVLDDGVTPCLEVSVFSLMNPGCYSRVRLDPRAPTAEVQIAAGACAERCCEQHGDPFDPDEAARDAREALEKFRASL